MSKSYQTTLTCNHCHKEFEGTIYESINVTLDPELRPLIENGEIYSYKCPHCGKISRIEYPFLYHDMDKHFMIHQGTIEGLLEQYDTIINCKDELINWANKGLIHASAMSFLDFSATRILLEHDYDYRIGLMAITAIGEMINRQIQEEKEEGIELIQTFLDTNEKKEMVVVAHLLDHATEEPFYKTFPFSQDIYDSLYKRYIPYLDKINTFLFDRGAAFYFLMNCPNQLNTLLKEKAKLALVENNGVYQTIVSLNGYFKNTAKVGDEIIAPGDNKMIKGKIKKIYDMPLLDVNHDLDAFYKATSFSYNLDIVTTHDSDDELDNSLLKDAILDDCIGADPLSEEGYNYIDHADIIVPYEVTLKDDIDVEEFLKTAKVGATFDQSILKSEYLSYKEGNNKYLCLYLEQKDIDKNANYTKGIYNLREFLMHFIKYCNDYNGIIFNKDSDKIIVSSHKVFQYLLSRLLLNKSNLISLMNEMTKDEIEYIGKMEFELYRKKLLKLDIDYNALNLSKEKFTEMMDNTQKKVFEVIAANHLNYIQEELNEDSKA